jgi:hypothetical protein
MLTKTSSGTLNTTPFAPERASRPPSKAAVATPPTAAASPATRLSAPYTGRDQTASSVKNRKAESSGLQA